MVRGIDFSPIDANVMADPYPYYEALRRGPVAGVHVRMLRCRGLRLSLGGLS